MNILRKEMIESFAATYGFTLNYEGPRKVTATGTLSYWNGDCKVTCSNLGQFVAVEIDKDADVNPFFDSAETLALIKGFAREAGYPEPLQVRLVTLENPTVWNLPDNKFIPREVAE